MMERRQALGGSLPEARRCATSSRSRCPTTSAFAELRSGLGRPGGVDDDGLHPPAAQPVPRRGVRPARRADHPRRGPHVRHGLAVPELKIYAAQGQKYEPVDHDLLLSYAESQTGQILEEGITEAGSMASFIAAGTAYATRGVPMVPFYTFYSMFGFQRVGDLIWQAADARTRGFLLGATAGRTTLLGEGLQHQDGHSLVLASTVPPVQAYDPAFAYEVGDDRAAGPAADVRRQRPGSTRDVFYYLTLYNENYEMPAMPEHVQPADVMRGLYRWAERPEGKRHAGDDAVLRLGAEGRPRPPPTLAEHYDVGVELWSATSYKALREEALAVERWNRLHPSQERAGAGRHRAARRRRGTDRRRHRLHEDRARADRPLRAAAARSCRSAPTGWAAATPARRCAGTSRSTPATSWSPCSAPSPARAASRPATVEKAIAEFDIDPDLPDPAHRDAFPGSRPIRGLRARPRPRRHSGLDLRTLPMTLAGARRQNAGRRS